MFSIKCPNCEEQIHVGQDTTICPKCDHPLMAEQADSTKLPEISPAEKENKRPISKIILAAIITITIASVAGIFGKSCTNGLFGNFSSSKSYSESTSKWSRYNLSDIGISIEMPGELKPLTVQLPDQVKSQILQYKSYQYDADDMVMAITYVAYIDSVVANSEGAIKGAIENIRTAKGVTNLQYYTTPQGLSKTSVRGSVERLGATLDINGFAIARGSTMWIVMCFNKRDNKDAVVAANRILASITFN